TAGAGGGPGERQEGSRRAGPRRGDGRAPVLSGKSGFSSEEEEVMSHGFDELAKGLAEGLSWREALGRGVGALQAPRREGSVGFDELAKDLARGISRREALWRCGAGLLGALLTSAGLGIPAPKAAPGRDS